MSVPKLRFKADDGSEFPEWEHFTVRDLFSLIKDTNTDSKNKNVITNSAEMGLIPQHEFFDKDIAVEGSIDKYTVIRLGDFVYNPRKSQTAPYGPFNCYTGKVDGIVSPLYFCLRPKHPKTTAYMLRYFSSPVWYPYIYNHGAQGGARHDRVGMTNELLLNIPVSLPCEGEQNKIAKTLSTLDHVINQTQTELEAREKQKRGVMQLLFSRKVRFKADDGSEFPEWEAATVGDLTISHKQGYYTEEHYVENGIKLARVSDLFNPEIDFKNMPMIKMSDKDYEAFKIDKGDVLIARSGSIGRYGIVSNIPQNEKVVFGSFLIRFRFNISLIKNQYFGEFYNSSYAYRQLLKITQAGANININAENIKKLSIPLPCIKEQEKIAACLSAFDEVIDKTKKELDAYRELKKGLLQQMFV